MPIYEYHCDKCNKDFERLVFGNEQPDCPSCNSKKVKKLMSASTFYSRGGHGYYAPLRPYFEQLWYFLPAGRILPR